jgi:5'-nucleotidase
MHVEERTDPRSRNYYWLDGYPVMDEEDGTDVYAVRNKRNVSVTPLTLDNTSKNIDEFKEKYGKKF